MSTLNTANNGSYPDGNADEQHTKISVAVSVTPLTSHHGLTTTTTDTGRLLSSDAQCMQL